MEVKEEVKEKDYEYGFIYKPYVIARLLNDEAKVTLYRAIIQDPAEALETAKRMAEDMQKIGMVTEIGIEEEELPF